MISVWTVHWSENSRTFFSQFKAEVYNKDNIPKVNFLDWHNFLQLEYWRIKSLNINAELIRNVPENAQVLRTILLLFF